ncbi:MAG: DUF47 family protein [Methanomicrobiales archaeon]|nr:DUF47 family protein [Methanomicrobiales archaeon]MDI6877016.1 DUF47 family protein [Methanomicrobiales archaeon]
MDRKSGDQKEHRGLFDSIFPKEYDFEGMLAEQADRTVGGVECFLDWLRERPAGEPRELERREEEVDDFRHRLEDLLTEAFFTPFDRQDLYYLSRQMDYILNFATETAREMHAFAVLPDAPILGMAEALLRGTKSVTAGVKALRSDGRAVERRVQETRDAINAIENIYIAGMAELLRDSDAMEALRRREIYHHLRDAGRALRDTADVLHRVAVGLG